MQLVHSTTPADWAIHLPCIVVYYATFKDLNTPQGTNYIATCLPSRKLSKLDEPDMQDTAGEAGTSSEVMYSYGPPYMAGQKQDYQLEHTFSSYVRIREEAMNDREKWRERVKDTRACGST